jgi:tetratricopeptide (TPR) repeat protein
MRRREGNPSTSRRSWSGRDAYQEAITLGRRLTKSAWVGATVLLGIALILTASVIAYTEVHPSRFWQSVVFQDLASIGTFAAAGAAWLSAFVLLRSRKDESQKGAYINDEKVTDSGLLLMRRLISKLAQDEEQLTGLGRIVEAVTSPERTAADMKMLARNSDALSVQDYREKVLANIEEAIAIYRQRSADNVFLPGLARSLMSQYHAFSALGRQREALEAVEEAFLIYQKLAVSQPDLFGPELRTCINYLRGELSVSHNESEESSVVAGNIGSEGSPDADPPTESNAPE